MQQFSITSNSTGHFKPASQLSFGEMQFSVPNTKAKMQPNQPNIMQSPEELNAQISE